MTEEQRAAQRGYMKAYNKAYYSANKDKIRARSKEYYERNIDERRASMSRYGKANKDKRRKYLEDKTVEIAKYRADYQMKNAAEVRARSAAWTKANRDKRMSYVKANTHKTNIRTARRRARKLQATPTWSDEFVISEAYELAVLRSKATGIIHHVDHVVPLQSKQVCGLHCEFNLRVIPGDDNLRKSNTRWPDMP
jgi:hypothetical protein